MGRKHPDDRIEFRHSSYYNNLFDFQLGMWAATIVSVLVLMLTNIYSGFNVQIIDSVCVVFALLVSVLILAFSIKKNDLKGKCDNCLLKEINCTICPVDDRRGEPKFPNFCNN